MICFRHRKTKKEYWQISRARGIYDSHNSLQYIVIVFSDYTERRKLEKQKDEFLGIASHELRTPVTSIKAYAQLLERRFQQQGNTDAARSVNKINRQLDKLTSLIKDLLDVTKIEQGELEMKHERFEYIELASEVVEDMQRITDHPITSLFCERTVIHGDKERIGQVLINLLSNAAKYSNTSSPIEVRIEKKDNLIWTHVKDTGIGISKEHQQKIFDRFFRSRSKENKNYAGLGLGLYISSQIIARHNGQIQVKSMRDKGSTFSFSLPLPLDRN